MAHPVVYIFTKKGCGACESFMKNYKNFERDVKSMSPNVELRVHTVDSDWKTRITTDYYHIDGLNYSSPTPPVAGLQYAPMFGVGRSNEVNDLSKLRVNGAILQPAQRMFVQPPTPTHENLRTWLTRNINELSSNSSSSTPVERVEKEKISQILDEIKVKTPTPANKSVIFRMVSLD